MTQTIHWTYGAGGFIVESMNTTQGGSRRKEHSISTSVLVVKDERFNVHLYPVHWDNTQRQLDMLEPAAADEGPLDFAGKAVSHHTTPTPGPTP